MSKDKAPKVTKSVMIKKMPDHLWTHFKAWCVLRKITVRDKIISLVRETIQQRLPGEDPK